MGSITTAVANQFKADLLKAMHNFMATSTFTADVTNASQALANVSSLALLAAAMSLSGTGIASNTVLARITGSTAIELSKPATATNTGVTITATGDTFNMALIKPSPTGTYDATSVNYSDITGNSDESSGTGYTAGGTALTNVTPTVSSGVALTNFSPNPSWTGATLSAAGCMIYNASQRGATANRAVSVHSFGGTQQVTAGTFTVVMPAADSTHAILRIA